MSSEAARPEGLSRTLSKWAQRLGLSDNEDSEVPAVPNRAGNGQTFDRAIDRRRRLYADIGDFLFAHDLDLTPLNFGLAYDYLTGNDHAIEKAVAAVLHDRGRLTNRLAETILSENRQEGVTPEALSDMLDKVEANLSSLTELTDTSRTAAHDYGHALQEHVADLDEDHDAAPIFAKLIELTRAMVEKTRQVEGQMRESQKQTRLLQKNLDTARKAAEHDHLTGLPNRRAFEGRLSEWHAKAIAQEIPLSIAFCDIDHFKQINDQHGHEVGDRVLKFVADLLAKVSDDECHVARHGGEEFVMLLPGKSPAEACEMVDGARADLARRSLVNKTTGERMEQISFSAGVANVLGYEDPRDALAAADRALYLAKNNGRNRVYIAN